MGVTLIQFQVTVAELSNDSVEPGSAVKVRQRALSDSTVVAFVRKLDALDGKGKRRTRFTDHMQISPIAVFGTDGSPPQWSRCSTPQSYRYTIVEVC
jgi:hypothetical protein